MQLHWASDVARQFIDAAFGRLTSGADGLGARVFDLGGPLVRVGEVAALIERLRPGVRVTVGDATLPFPDGFDDSALRAAVHTVYETPLEEGVRRTIEAYEGLAGVVVRIPAG
jgi:nucleoside-diphosphate-sugar epimerase